MTERSESERAELVACREQRMAQIDYSADLQRFIEDLCHDRTIREPQTDARHHYEMAVAYRLAAQDQKPVAWQWRHPNGEWVDCDEPSPNELRDEPEKFRCLYLSPPPAAGWDEAIEACKKVAEKWLESFIGGEVYVARSIVNAIEALSTTPHTSDCDKQGER